MLRRWGSFVKSTVSVSFSRPGKYSSKLGVSMERVAKISPLGVRWLLMRRFWEGVSDEGWTALESYLLFCKYDNAISIDFV